jgi:hypothetical protein
MLGLDLDVGLALVLSVASTALCIGYGVMRWNAGDDARDDVPEGGSARAEIARAAEKELDRG